MGTPTQAHRAVRIQTPLPEDTLLFSSMSGKERLSELFDYQLELLSEDTEVDLNLLLGQNITIGVERPDGETRYFNGYICDGGQLASEDDLYLYNFSVRPWLWFLTRTADCRIFQEMSVPDIIKEMFRSAGFSDFEDKLDGTYSQRNYCVQYRETAFDFVSRLMEQEGIYYYFKHENGKHTLVLCDRISAHAVVPGYKEIPLYPGSPNPRPDVDAFDSWIVRKQIHPGKVVTGDFNFVNPGGDMIAKSEVKVDHAQSHYEFFDYTGEYPAADDGVKERAFGERVAKFRMEALQATHETAVAEGEVYGPGAGSLFELVGAEHPDHNKEYLVVNATFTISQGGYSANSKDEAMSFFTRLEVISSDIQYRAPRKTRKPVMQGPQTAIVVGKAGEEIWTDKHGRIKLHFHWDRHGKSDENSSCWVRVSQAWAGTKFGAMHIPRINQEVIVEFIDGDPDQPIVTGRVYNGDNKVPYDLPTNATQSGIKSRSSKGGGPANFNEIRMEDKNGEEELYIHAERNHTQVTENDRSESVGHDRTLKVGRDKSETIDRDKTIEVNGKHTETIVDDTKIDITKGDYSLTVQKGKTKMSSKMDTKVTTNKKMELKSDSDMQLESDTKITLKVGGSQITITPGKIEISSAIIEVKAQAKMSTESGGMNEVKGSLVLVQGSGPVTIKGAAVAIN